MSRQTRSLNKRDIAKCLIFENIPSASELDFSNEDHDDTDKDPDFNLYSDSDDRNSDECYYERIQLHSRFS